jgi:hypothetical protein
MPILFEGYNECRRCGKAFEWVHYEMIRNNLRSGRFQVERLPSKPQACNVRCVGDNHTEYTVICPRCGCKNSYTYERREETQNARIPE